MDTLTPSTGVVVFPGDSIAPPLLWEIVLVSLTELPSLPMKTLPEETIALHCSLAPVVLSREGIQLAIVTAEGIAGDDWIVMVQLAPPLKGNAPSDLSPEIATAAPTTLSHSPEPVPASGPLTIASGRNIRPPCDLDEQRTQRITQTSKQHMIELGT